jgi:glycosyltransferase involved in cell wall biosynthesis
MSRVCVIRQFYFPDDPRVRNQVRALEAEGHDVDVICLRRSGQPRFEQAGRVTIRRLPLSHQRGGKLRYLAAYSAFFALAALWTTALHLRRGYGVIVTHSLPDTLVFTAIVPKLMGAKIVLDLHECMPEFFATKFGVTERNPAVKVIAWLEQASIRMSDFAITCNEPMRRVFLNRGADPHRIGVVMNSADETIFRAEAVVATRGRERGRFTIVSHGTIEDRYGLDTAVKAVALLRDEIPGLRLQIFGEGPQERELRLLACRLGVEDRVWFGGYVPRRDLLRAIEAADAGLVATKRDAFRDLTHCLKMFEFVSMQRPVICSRIPAVEACFDEESFLYFAAGDERDLAQAIKRLQSDPDISERLVARATIANEPFRWRRQRENYLLLMKPMLAGRSPNPRRQNYRPEGA